VMSRSPTESLPIQEWKLRRCELTQVTKTKEGLSETSTPVLIRVMSPNHSRTPISVRNTESSTVVTMHCYVWRQNCSSQRETTKVCLSSLNCFKDWWSVEQTYSEPGWR
jgi:hypothetical protein